jgi:hypothetical protein
MKKMLVVLLVLLSTSALASETLIFQSDFDSGFVNWDYKGADWSLVTPGYGESGQAARVTYYASGSKDYQLEKNLSWDYLNEVFVEFDFKVDYQAGHQAYGGCKFLKIFGVPRHNNNYANVTFSMNYYDKNELKEVHYGGGDPTGTQTARDSQSTIRYNGTLGGSHYDEPIILTKTQSYSHDNEWHRFKAYMRYNDDGQQNGEYKVWIDGAVRLHAINIINRHKDNDPFIWKAHFGGYNGATQSPFEPWHLTIDNVVISKPAAPKPGNPNPPGQEKEKPPSNGGKKK